MSSDEKDTKTQETIKSKIKNFLIKRQTPIFAVLISVGLFLLVMSQIADIRLLSEGIAFIIVGCVGIMMSLTTTDIGSSIKNAIYSVGKQNRIALATSLDGISSSQQEISSSLKKLATSQQEISLSLKKLATSLDGISSSQQEIKDMLQKKDQ